MIKYYYTIF